MRSLSARRLLDTEDPERTISRCERAKKKVGLFASLDGTGILWD